MARRPITWDTGSNAVGDVYVGTAGNEKLFASGPKGSQDAPWIAPGSTEFRLYNHADHKLLAQLTVTMPLVRCFREQPIGDAGFKRSSTPFAVVTSRYA